MIVGHGGAFDDRWRNLLPNYRLKQPAQPVTPLALQDGDRAFLRDVLHFPNVDAGDGWLIFGLPPAEVAVHPSDNNDMHELYLMCDDVEGLIASMNRRSIKCSPLHNRGWGLLTEIALPGGGRLGVYQPKHERPKAMTVGRTTMKREP